VSLHSLRFGGCGEFIFAAFLLCSILLATHFPGKNKLPTYFIAHANNIDVDMAPALALLQFETHFSVEHVWNYCWMNAAYFLGNPTLANPASTLISGFAGTVFAESLVLWRLQTVSAEGVALQHGGDIIQVALQGPALLRPRIFDLRNGTYLIAFSAVDCGSYTAKVTMRWPSCRAYAFCSVEDIRQPIEDIATLKFTVKPSVNGDSFEKKKTMYSPTGLKVHYAAGRWAREAQSSRSNSSKLHPLLRGQYTWQPFSENLTSFPVSNLRNKWLYIVGDSLSEHAFEQLVGDILTESCSLETVTHRFVNRFDGSFMEEQYKRDAMQLFYCSRLNFTLSFTFFPDSFPVGGFKNTRYPLVNELTNSIDAAHNVTFALPHCVKMFHKAIRSTEGVPKFQFPDAVVFNFGLHYATPLDPPLYVVLLRHMLSVIRQEFPVQTTLIWRSTAYTHFEKKALALKWNCRTPVRTELLNELSSKVVEALGIEVLDYQALTAARPDATPDNRHYSLGNVRATFNNILLNRLNALWTVN